MPVSVTNSRLIYDALKACNVRIMSASSAPRAEAHRGLEGEGENVRAAAEPETILPARRPVSGSVADRPVNGSGVTRLAGLV